MALTGDDIFLLTSTGVVHRMAYLEPADAIAELLVQDLVLVATEVRCLRSTECRRSGTARCSCSTHSSSRKEAREKRQDKKEEREGKERE